MTSSQYALSEQLYIWQQFISYAKSHDNYISLFNPAIFYENWKTAAMNYYNQSSDDFWRFCSLLSSNLSELKLNGWANVNADFYKYCIDKYLTDNCKTGWDQLTKAQNSYIQKKAEDGDNFLISECIQKLDELLLKNLDNQQALNYINQQFLTCFLCCQNSYELDLQNTHFTLHSDNLCNENSKLYKENISLMSNFLEAIKHRKYHYNLDTLIAAMLPECDIITFGRLISLINSILNNMRYYVNDHISSDTIHNALNIINKTPMFGLVSPFPNEKLNMDSGNLNNYELNKAAKLSRRESLKIVAGYYNDFKGKEMIRNLLSVFLKTLKADEFDNVIADNPEPLSLKSKSNMYTKMLDDFLEYFK